MADRLEIKYREHSISVNRSMLFDVSGPLIKHKDVDSLAAARQRVDAAWAAERKEKSKTEHAMPRTAFAAELRRWRERLDLTQRQAAEQLDIHYDALRDWELGRRVPANPGPVRKAMQLAVEKAKQP